MNPNTIPVCRHCGSARKVENKTCGYRTCLTIERDERKAKRPAGVSR